MNIPKKIRIGSFDYNVDYTNETLILNAQQCYGLINYENTEIKIAKNIQNKQKQEQTFLHELFHGIVKEYKIDFTEDEENIVDKLANGIYQILKDNKELFEDIN